MMEEFQFGAYTLKTAATGFAISHKGKAVLECGPVFVRALRSELRPYFHFGTTKLRRRVKGSAPNREDYQAAAREKGVRISGLLSDREGTPYELVFKEAKGNLAFALSLPQASLEPQAPAPAGFNEIQFSFTALQGESFYGFGEQFSHLDLRGKAFPLCVGEQGIGRGAQPLSTLVNLVSPGSAGDAFTTYAPMPVFVTSEGRAAAFNESVIYHMDLCKTKKDSVSVTASATALSGTWFFADTPLELIEKHTKLTGRLKPLPDFTYGTVLGLRGGRDAVEKVLDSCVCHGAPVTALWIEDWQGRRGKNGGPPLWWKWFPDEKLYPDFKNWAHALGERNIALLGYANPFLSVAEDNPLYVEGREKGYFVKTAEGKDWIYDFFSGKEYTFVSVDLTLPEAYAWLKERMIEGMVDSGLSGWMADYGEYIPLTSVSHNPNPVEAHCATPVLWQRLNSEMVSETGNGGKFFIFHRSSGLGGNAYALSYWAGDQNPTFDEHDGLASSLCGILSGGISGMSINHTDIGGFTTLITPLYKLVRKKELMLRWMEYAAFTPIFRTHDGNYANSLVYQFYDDEAGYSHFARMAKIHQNLFWYFKLLEREACQRGTPMMRALWLHYPQDRACRKIKSQYLLGEDLLVTPVLRNGASSVRGYIPRGRWVHAFTGETHEGATWATMDSGLGSPAVLIRQESERFEDLRRSLSKL